MDISTIKPNPLEIIRTALTFDEHDPVRDQLLSLLFKDQETLSLIISLLLKHLSEIPPLENKF